MASEETENSLGNNLTITFTSNTSHQSLSTELIALLIYLNCLTKLQKSPNQKLLNCKNFPLTACLSTLIDLPSKLPGIQLPTQSLFRSTVTFIVFVSLSLISGKSTFLHDAGYIATIENSCVPTVVSAYYLLLAQCNYCQVLCSTSYFLHV